MNLVGILESGFRTGRRQTAGLVSHGLTEHDDQASDIYNTSNSKSPATILEVIGIMCYLNEILFVPIYINYCCCIR